MPQAVPSQVGELFGIDGQTVHDVVPQLSTPVFGMQTPEQLWKPVAQLMQPLVPQKSTDTPTLPGRRINNMALGMPPTVVVTRTGSLTQVATVDE